MEVRILSVLRPSAEYDYDYVEHLRDGLAKHAPGVEFQCLVDSEWPGWWCKLAAFRPSVKGDFLMMDLDSVPVGDLTDMLSIGRLTALRDFNVLKWLASGVMFIPEAAREEVWREWIKDPAAHMKEQGGHGDGGFLRKFWQDKATFWQDALPGQVVSYKNHVRGKGLPPDARLVCFHGSPRPRDVGWIL